MKILFKNSKIYLVLFIIFISVLIPAVLFSNYYPIYKSLTGPLVFDLDTDITIEKTVKNPFETINIIEEIDEDTEKDKGLTEDNDLADEETDSTDGIIDDIEAGPYDNTKKPSYNYIVKKYKNEFENLRQKQEDELNSLVEQCKREYVEGGSKKTSIFILGYKYLDLLKSLERRSNKEFDNLMNELKTELSENSYETDIVKEVRAHYNYYKKNLRAQIIREGTEYL
ncbi:MAG: hypothetical protein M0P14_03275 [Alkaliphilus sp.]|nr:hypothetical protein [Alkaliphilus sp.]